MNKEIIEKKLKNIQNLSTELIRKNRYQLMKKEHKQAYLKYLIDFSEIIRDVLKCKNEDEIIDLISAVSVYYARLKYEENKKEKNLILC